jgi:uncharacterized protein (TIGR02145 family)
MKAKNIIQRISLIAFLTISLSLSTAYGQNDTMYIVKGGVAVGKYNVSTQVDSVIFYKSASNVNTPNDTIYIMKGGVAVGKHKISSQVDSVIFYKPIILNSTSGTFTDIRDNMVYNWIKIGNQVWMAENLKYLPGVVGPTIGSPSTPYYYVSGYNGTSVTEAKSTANFSTYGVLYNWAAAMDGSASSSANPSGVKGVCPTGWHLPSDAEWTQLTDYLGGRSVAGGKLKETGTTHWNSPNTGATNEVGFTARPGGARYPYTAPGEFYALKRMAYFRTSTKGGGNDTIYSYRRGISNESVGVSRTLTDALKESAFCVRCVKD